MAHPRRGIAGAAESNGNFNEPSTPQDPPRIFNGPTARAGGDCGSPAKAARLVYEVPDYIPARLFAIEVVGLWADRLQGVEEL